MFVFVSKFAEVKRKSKTTSHVSRGILPLRDIYVKVVCHSAYIWLFHFFSAIHSLGFGEALYNINQNESVEHITQITEKQIPMLLFLL